MDRGGTITWYLTANDADFTRGLRKARAEAKQAGADIDRDLNKSSASATESLRKMGDGSNSAASNLRTLSRESKALALDSAALRASLTNTDTTSRTLATSLGQTAMRSTSLKDSIGGLKRESNGLAAALGGVALGAFSKDLGSAGREANASARGFRDANISLDDFHRSIGRSAAAFRNLQIALRGFELTSLVIGASIAVGALIELAGAVFAASGALYAAPAAVAAFAGAFGALSIATFGIEDAFKKLNKQTAGTVRVSGLARRESDLMRNAMRQDEQLTRRLTDLKEDYNDVLKELANERMKQLNEQIERGIEGWNKIASAASSYLDISKRLTELNQDVAEAQMNLNSAIIQYGPASQQALNATRDLYAAQGAVAEASAKLDSEYNNIKDSVKDLATNLESLKKANRNEMSASLLNLKAMKQDKQLRGENTNEITRMIKVLDDLINIKDTKLTINPDFAGAQKALDSVKAEFPDIAVAAKSAVSDTEVSLTKSLQNIAQSMDDVRKERQRLQEDLSRNLSEARADDATAGAGGAGEDPFEGLSINARKFVIALKEVYDAFMPIKNIIQDRFFDGLDTEIRNLATTMFPILQTGLGNIATSMNGVIKEASRVVQQPFFTGAMTTSMATTTKAIDILKGAIEPLAKAFTDLVNIGNPYVIMLSKFVVQQSKLLAAYTGSEEGQKAINQAIRDGFSAIRDIIGLVSAVIGLFTDLFKISNEGDSIIETLTGIVNSMREWLKEGENADKVRSLFESVSTILVALASTAGAFAEAILNIVQAYNELDGPAKDFITQIIVLSAVMTPLMTYASSVMASFKLLFFAGKEGFQLMQVGIFGVQKAMAGFKLAQQGLTAAQIASADIGVGAWGRIGAAVSKVKNGVGTAASAISSGIGNAGSKVGEIGAKFGTAAADAVRHGATIAAQGAMAAAGWISNAARVAAAWALQFAAMIARGVATVAVMVTQAVLASAAWIAGAVATAAAWVVANAAMLGIWGLIIAAVVGAVALIVANWGSIVDFFKGVWDAIVGFISGTIEWIKTNWPLLLAILTGPIGIAALIIAQNWESIKGFFVNAWNYIKNVWSGVAGFFQSVWNGIVNVFRVVGSWFSGVFQGAWNGIKNIWNSVGAFFSGIWGSIKDSFNGVRNLGNNIVEGLWNGINDMVGWIGDKIRGFSDGVLKGIKNFFNIHSPSRVMRDEVGKMLGLGIADGITDSTGDAVKAAQDAASAITGAFAMDAMVADLGVNATGTINTQFAPSMANQNGSADTFGGGGIVINQTNEVHSELDMDQVNRNLSWELSKI